MSRRSRWLIATGAVAVLVVGIVAILNWNGRQSADPASSGSDTSVTVEAGDPSGSSEPAGPLGGVESTDAEGNEVQTNALGDVLKEPGQAGELVGSGGDVLFSITVSDVAFDDTCPSRDGDEIGSERGTFVILQVEATLSDEDEEMFFPLLSDTFSVVDGEGELIGMTTESSWLCQESEELLPAGVGAGQSVTGIVVLDSSSEQGEIRYAPDGGAGWAWRL